MIENMGEEVFITLSVIIGIVLLSMGLMKVLKQPMIIGYIIAGTAISFFIPSLLQANTAFQSFGNLGIALLLFMVGMELNPTIIKDLGKTSVIAGLFQVIVTGGLGYFIATMLGFPSTTSVFLAIGFAFSSTIVVLKLLGDKEDMESTSGRLSIGILIVQDLIAMLLIFGMATFKSIEHTPSAIIVFVLIAKIIGLAIGMYVLSKYFIPIVTKKIAESQEYLFLFSIGRCFILGALFYKLGFGIEIGTLIAGITLASSSYRFEITSRIKPLRDFFIVIFFVMLGSHVNFGTITMGMLLPVIIFIGFVLIIKPIITMIILGFLGHTRKNNFLTGISLGQISEFSFLVITMGITSGYIQNPAILSIITLVGLITIAGSSYSVIYGKKFYHFIKPILSFLPGVRNKEYKIINKKDYEIVIFGYGRFGSNIYTTLHKTYKKILVIDENPGIIEHLQKKKIPCIYGDISDIDFIQELNIKNSKMIISTIKTFEENLILLKTTKIRNPNIIIVLVSNQIHEAIKLYEQGADYVILPHYIGVDHTSLMLEEYGFDIQRFMENKKTLVHELKNRHQDLMIEMLQK
ncbi:MAG: cation:proton antiporter [candidate division SR1 bacterium]|nr:cation:proton antiporter [candidate division SR1 bacterium]